MDVIKAKFTVFNTHKGKEGLKIVNGKTVYDDSWLHPGVLENDYLQEHGVEADGGSKELVQKSEELGNLALIIDLAKGGGTLHKGKLVRRMIPVKGKNGRTFYRMQWIDPHKDIPGSKPAPSGKNETTYSHHEKGIRDIERARSNRYPVVHHETSGLKNKEHNYRTDKSELRRAEEAYHKGEPLPPVEINDKSEIVRNHHLVDLAKKLGLSHVPVIVHGNTMEKKKLEDKLKNETMVLDQDEETGKQELKPASLAQQGIGGGVKRTVHAEYADDVNQFINITAKKYTKQHLMSEAERQGINFNRFKKDGTALPDNSNILWMRAYDAIVNHINTGGKFEVQHNEKDVDKRMEQDGKDSVHKHFLKLLEKHGSKDNLMEWARKNGIKWKEKDDPLINWMYASEAIKHELRLGKMVDGVRTRQKDVMEEASLVISDQVKEMVKALGQRHGKPAIMNRADELGIEYDKFNKSGQPLPSNSPILWMRAATGIQKYIAKGNSFLMGDKEYEDNGTKAEVGDYGDGVKLTKWQRFAVDIGKRNSRNQEPQARKWAIKALMVDSNLNQDEAAEKYDQFMERARGAKVMVHWDPFEELGNGLTLIEQLSADEELKNDYENQRQTLDREAREYDESALYGDEYSDATDKDRPHYGVIDLFNRGLQSSPYGDVAFVLKDDVKKRGTGTFIDSSSIPYGEEGKLTKSLEDPHHLIVDRWTTRWKQPNKADAQRRRAMDAVLSGKTNSEDSKYFEAQLHGNIKLREDVEHILVPKAWKDSPEHQEKHDLVDGFATFMGIPIVYS